MNAWQRRLQQEVTPDARRVIVKHELVDALRTLIKKLEDMGPDETDRIVKLADDGEVWGAFREIFEAEDADEQKTGRMTGIRYEVMIRASNITRRAKS